MADVCLFLEGTYPYVSGGVSGCVHQLVTSLPRTTFHLVYLGTESSEMLSPKYSLPPNIVGLQEVFLFDELEAEHRRNTPLSRDRQKALTVLHSQLHRPVEQRPLTPKHLHDAITALFDPGQPAIFESLAGTPFWEQVVSEYMDVDSQLPFVEFFYSWRSAHLPVYRALSTPYPKAHVYHALCTGYAGLAALSASIQFNAPLFLTEHGIYAHERSIEIAEAEWLMAKKFFAGEDHSSNLKRWWIQMFKNVSQMVYSSAAEIITLYEGNRSRQLLDGAPPDRTKIIPNGIHMKLKNLRRRKPSWRKSLNRPFTIGFIGRVVAIKDIKTLIKTVCNLVGTHGQVQCRIIGPTDEDPQYFKQCQELVDSLGLTSNILFEGKQNITDVLEDIDCLILTSISEAQPLVILEANIAGIPVVATDVGGCRELLEGRTESDRMLGISGLLAPLGNADAISAQVSRFITDETLWENCSLNGIERASSYYNETDLLARYDRLYKHYMAGNFRIPGLAPGVLPWQE